MTRKKLLVLLGSMCLALMLVAMACAGPAPSPTPSPSPSPTPSPSPSPTPSPSPPPTAEVIEWKAQSIFNSTSLAHVLAEEWADRVNKATGGKLIINWYPSEALVPDDRTFEAVASGGLDLHFTQAAYYTGIIPEGDLITEQPGGTLDYLWFYMLWNNWGWADIWEPIVNSFGAKTLATSFVDGAPIRSNVPIRHLSDVEGIKLRSGGGFARYAAGYLGAKLVDLTGAEIYTAMQLGTIDAFDYSAGVLDWDWGFQEVAPYILYPEGKGWSRMEFLVNMESYNALPEDVRIILDEVSLAFEPYFCAEIHAADVVATQRMVDEWDNEVIFLPDDEFQQYLEYAHQFLMEEAVRVSPTMVEMMEIYMDHLPDSLHM